MRELTDGLSGPGLDEAVRMVAAALQLPPAEVAARGARLLDPAGATLTEAAPGTVTILARGV